MRGLTIKQQNFCNGIVSGLSGYEAYKAAYNTKGNPNTVNQEVVKLLARDDIQEHIKTLQRPLEIKAKSEALTEREKIKDILWNRLELAIVNNDDAMIVKYTDQINKMNHEYINTNINIDNSANVLDTVDIDTLKQLSGSS